MLSGDSFCLTPASPAALQAEARERLGIAPETTSPSFEYSAELDEIVESYWGKRQFEGEIRNPTAERVYHALVNQLILGGSPASVEENAETLLRALSLCCSPWMRQKAGRALWSIRCLYRTAVSPDTLRRIDGALSIVGHDVTTSDPRQSPDLLELLGRYSPSKRNAASRGNAYSHNHSPITN
jgi:hypothetical protein